MSLPNIYSQNYYTNTFNKYYFIWSDFKHIFSYVNDENPKCENPKGEKHKTNAGYRTKCKWFNGEIRID